MANSKKPVEDIFSETEGKKTQNNGKPANGSKAKSNNSIPPVMPGANQAPRNKRPIIVLFVFAAVVLLGLGWIVFSRGGLLNPKNKNSKKANNNAVADSMV